MEWRWKSDRHGDSRGLDKDAEDSEDGLGINGSQYDVTDTGESHVGK